MPLFTERGTRQRSCQALFGGHDLRSGGSDDAVGHHALVQVAHSVAAAGQAKPRKQPVHEATYCAEHHAAAEAESHRHVLQVGFVDGGGMVGEAAEHFDDSTDGAGKRLASFASPAAVLRNSFQGNLVPAKKSIDSFDRKILDCLQEVMDCYRMSGEIDYLIRLALPDIDAYDAFYKRLIAKIELSDVTSMFAMEEIKSTTRLPLSYLP